MGSYAQAAEHYDLLYSGFKDYEGEAARVAGPPGPVRRNQGVSCLLPAPPAIDPTPPSSLALTWRLAPRAGMLRVTHTATPLDSREP